MSEEALQVLLDELSALGEKITQLMGTNKDMHGFYRGTYQAALAEAQGCFIGKSGGATAVQSLQSVAKAPHVDGLGNILYTRAQTTNSFDHYNSMMGATENMQKQIVAMETKLAEIQRISPEAARTARDGMQPIMTAGNQRVQLAMDVEKAVIEITQSGNSNRLADQVITVTSRTEAGLLETQMQNRGRQLLPNAIGNGQQLLTRIRTMPINVEDAKKTIGELATKGSAAVAAATQALRTGGAVVRSYVLRAATVIGEALISLGSSLITPIVVPKGILSPPGSSTDA